MAPTQGTTQGPRTAWFAREAGEPTGADGLGQAAVSHGRPWSDHLTSVGRF